MSRSSVLLCTNRESWLRLFVSPAFFTAHTFLHQCEAALDSRQHSRYGDLSPFESNERINDIRQSHQLPRSLFHCTHWKWSRRKLCRQTRTIIITHLPCTSEWVKYWQWVLQVHGTVSYYTTSTTHCTSIECRYTLMQRSRGVSWTIEEEEERERERKKPTAVDRKIWIK